LAGRKILGDMPKAAPCEEFRSVETRNPDGFLSPVLQRMETQGAHRRGFPRTDYTENAALFAQLVAVLIEEGIGEIHRSALGAIRARPNGDVAERLQGQPLQLDRLAVVKNGSGKQATFRRPPFKGIAERASIGPGWEDRNEGPPNVGVGGEKSFAEVHPAFGM